jgi:RHS repeat-associated protein
MVQTLVRSMPRQLLLILLLLIGGLFTASASGPPSIPALHKHPVPSEAPAPAVDQADIRQPQQLQSSSASEWRMSAPSPRLLAPETANCERLDGDFARWQGGSLQLQAQVGVSSNVRHRYMDPTIGRFTQSDPAMSGSNWYAYAGSDPVNRIDPMGTDWAFISSTNNLGAWEFVDGSPVDPAFPRPTHDPKPGADDFVLVNESALSGRDRVVRIDKIREFQTKLRVALNTPIARDAEEKRDEQALIDAEKSSGLVFGPYNDARNRALDKGIAGTMLGGELGVEGAGEIAKASIPVGELLTAGRAAVGAADAYRAGRAAADAGDAAAGAIPDAERSVNSGVLTDRTAKDLAFGSQNDHHLATVENSISKARGGPWTPQFEELFNEAEMSMHDPANLAKIFGHYGPHPEVYHRLVYDRLVQATEGLSGDAYKSAFRAELSSIKREAMTPGTELNDLIRRVPSSAP